MDVIKELQREKNKSENDENQAPLTRVAVCRVESLHPPLGGAAEERLACDLRIPRRTFGATKFGPGAHPDTVERYCKRKIEIVCSKTPGVSCKKN